MKDLFEKNNYRFGVETFLLMYLDQYQFVLGSDLVYYSKSQELFNEDNPCNIYFVLRRPKVTVIPDSINISNKKASFKLLVHSKEKHIEVDLRCEFTNANSKIEYYTEYPYNILEFRDQEKALMVARPSTLLDSNLVLDNSDCEELDYEVLYIGQAYGKNGKRTALDRLASHETVQKIYSQTLTDNPESDIWIMLCKFTQDSMLFSAGKDLVKVKKEDEKIEEERMKHVFDNNGLSITERQRINFTEAALIKYFEPYYNIKFKDIFPSPRHTSYKECYDLDIRAINIELDTSEMVRKIFTDKTNRKVHHMKMYEFNDDKDRISLLEVEKNCVQSSRLLRRHRR
jgi:hypothetical protein